MSVVQDLQISYIKAENHIPSWYEFLLKPNLLEEHLQQENPDPSGTSLIKIFFDQVNKSSHTKDGKAPIENRRTKILKLMALKTAAFLKWKLALFEKELPVATIHQLLTEFLKACKTSVPPATQNEMENSYKNLHDHALGAIILYCRWGAQTDVKSTFQNKSTNGRGLSQFSSHQGQQRVDEVVDQIVVMVKEQVACIVQCLEGVLHFIKRPIYLPGMECISSSNICNPLSNNLDDIPVKVEELHAQVCYDLASLHFTHGYYEKSLEMFNHVRLWRKRLPTLLPDFCDFDEDKLNGYILASSSIVESIKNFVPKPKTDNKNEDAKMVDLKNGQSKDTQNQHAKLYQMIEFNLKGPKLDSKLVCSCIEESLGDKLTLSSAYIDQVENVLLDRGLEPDIMFDLRWLSVLSRTLSELEQPVNIWSYSMSLSELERLMGIVEKLEKKLKNQRKRKKLESFLCSLANNLSGAEIRTHLTSNKIFQKCLMPETLQKFKSKLDENEETEMSVDVAEGISADPNLSEDINSQIVTLERNLICSLDPHDIKTNLIKLRKLVPSGRSFLTSCSHWKISDCYNHLLVSFSSNPLLVELLHLFLAKVIHCTSDLEFLSAKALLGYLKDQLNPQSNPLVAPLVANELLKVDLLEVLTNDSISFKDDKQCHQIQAALSDVLASCRSLITSVVSDPTLISSLPDDLVELSVALLLNVEDFHFLKSLRTNSSAPLSASSAVTFSHLLASLQFSLHQHDKSLRTSAAALWKAMTSSFASSGIESPASRHFVKKSDSNTKKPEICRSAILNFIRLLRNPRIIKTFLSTLVHLHRLCCPYLIEDVTLPNSSSLNGLWPTQVEGVGCSRISVSHALRETLAHCLQTDPKEEDWLRVQGDLNLAFGNPGTALRCYLLIGAHATKFFTEINCVKFLQEDIVLKMVKCCEQLKCFTQAAVLCQLLKDIDYSLAFKDLQENRHRCDAAELHYTHHFWDVQLLEHAIYFHHESGEIGKKKAAIKAIALPELNHSNSPQVGERVQLLRTKHFFQSMLRQYLC